MRDSVFTLESVEETSEIVEEAIQEHKAQEDPERKSQGPQPLFHLNARTYFSFTSSTG